MKCFSLPILPINLERNTDKKLSDRGIDGIELEYPWQNYKPRQVFTGAFVAAGIDGLAVSFCAEIPNDRVIADKQGNKTRVFEDDCLEVFIRPANKDNSTPSPIYYGWEFNANGACLDYRVGVGSDTTKDGIVNGNVIANEDGISILEKRCSPTEKQYDGGEKVSGFLHDTVADKKLLFDYDWQSHAVSRIHLEEEFWYLELFIPWYDFDIDECPKPGTIWHMTINRIDEFGYKRAIKKGLANARPGLLCLLDDVSPDLGAFHQPDKFAEFTFQIAESAFEE